MSDISTALLAKALLISLPIAGLVIALDVARRRYVRRCRRCQRIVLAACDTICTRCLTAIADPDDRLRRHFADEP